MANGEGKFANLLGAQDFGTPNKRYVQLGVRIFQ